MKKVFASLCLILAIALASCGYSEDDLAAARNEGYQEGYDAGYNKGYIDGFDKAYLKGFDDGKSAPRQLFKPASGTILSGREYSDSTITVTASSSNDYVVSLKDGHGTEYVCFYIQARDTVTIGVPSEYLYVYFASGKEWYGYGRGLMFGKDTIYSKDDDALDFYNYSWEYTLYPVSNGNFSETPSSEDEFF